MNFTDSSENNNAIGQKPAERKANEAGESPNESSLDKAAMDGAQKAQSRQHHDEQTNSSNTTFSK